MTTEAFTPPSPITIATAGPHAIPFPYETGAVRAAVEDLLTGQMTDLIFGTDFTVAPAKDEASGNLTLSGPALTAHTGKKLHITRESTEQQGWVGTQGQREKGLERQLDHLARRLQEVSRLARAAVRIAAPTLKPFVPQAGRAIIFNAQGQPMNGPDASEITAAQSNAAAAAASASAAAGSLASAQTAEANAQAWAGTVNSTFLQTSSLRCTLGGTATAITLTTGGSVVSVSAGQKFRAIMASDCSGASTLKIDSLAPVSIKTPLGSPVFAGYWAAGEEVEFSYDGAGWVAYPSPQGGVLQQVTPIFPEVSHWRLTCVGGGKIPKSAGSPLYGFSELFYPAQNSIQVSPFTIPAGMNFLVSKWAFLASAAGSGYMFKFVVYKSGPDGLPSYPVFQSGNITSVTTLNEIVDGVTVLKGGQRYWAGFIISSASLGGPSIARWPEECGEIIDVTVNLGRHIYRGLGCILASFSTPSPWSFAITNLDTQLENVVSFFDSPPHAIWYQGTKV